MPAPIQPTARMIADAITGRPARADVVVIVATPDGAVIGRWRGEFSGQAADVAHCLDDWMGDYAIRYAAQPLSGPVEPLREMETAPAWEDPAGTPERWEEDEDGDDGQLQWETETAAADEEEAA